MDAKKARTEAAAPPTLQREQVYDKHGLERLAAIEKQFTQLFGSAPAFFARAPGRVNLIGEHIDYSGYGVLPMALQQDMLVAVGFNDTDTCHLHNTFPKFTPRTFPSVSGPIDPSKHDWGNYFQAGYKGVLEHTKLAKPRGLNILMDGCVPQSAGLSSSSAVVCCAALATAHANNIEISKLQFATLCAKSEQYVGVEGGGMDQAISFLAEANEAQFIEFNPVRGVPVPLPTGAKFVIANTLVKADKYVSAGSCYNKRVVECRLAAGVLAVKLGLQAPLPRTLGTLQKACNLSLEDMLARVDANLRTGNFTKPELQELLHCKDVHELEEKWLSPSTVTQEEFNLHDRAYHVFGEAELVSKFRNAMNAPSDDILETLGNLMNQSHHSCDKMYECSCPELNTLVSLCREAGAYGSRLTGAGWGGCTVSLVPENKVESFLAKVKAEYFDKDPERAAVVKDNLFVTSAGQGACVISV